MKIGIVDLDTSHPAAWIPIERELGHEIAGVWDGGSVHPPAYVRTFAEEHEIPRVFDSLEQMVTAVDGAIIHGCNWDTHVDKARPFVQAGKAVLLDKPVVGHLRDVNQLVTWAGQGARIAGGSSLRFAYEVQAFLAQPESERGTPHTVLCGCGVDEYNYGIHAYAMLSGIMGPGIRSVRHLKQGVQRQVQFNWADGRTGYLSIGKVAQWLPFHATIVTEEGVTQFIVDSTKVYRALLERVLPYLAAEVDEPPLVLADLVEPELAALAARKSWLNGNAEIDLADLTEDDEGYDGAAFADGYRKVRYPG